NGFGKRIKNCVPRTTFRDYGLQALRANGARAAGHLPVACRFATSLRLSKIAPGDFVSFASHQGAGCAD
ncbi:MAG: hypothetical protein RQ722_13215, partial [Desulfuromonadales bacterium]|nr:hypothetical protein [Desulfuromonadales bacterium]